MGTYLEDYLESMYMLPSEIKRNFDLMRELDKTSYPLIEELKSAHKAFLLSARKKVAERCADTERSEPDEQELRALVGADAALERLHTTHQRVVQKLDEKIAIAAQSYDVVDHHIRRLDQDLEAYAALLRQSGEFEEDKAPKKHKSRHGTSGITGAASASAGGAGERTSERGAASMAGSQSSGVGAITVSTNKSSKQSVAGGYGAGGSSGSVTGRKRSATEASIEVAAAPPALPMVAEDLPIDPNEPIYCDCRRVSYGQMVGCDNDDCKYEWFHFECVGLTDQPTGKWYCKDCKALLGIK
ncbi:hypothetical protein PybrP1_009618 [[Pythium] brassicae (nom. inval.)]|nr:hypothetical protein PybrP1_009618 [[Pythium] brassicae (nom. inval.)]